MEVSEISVIASTAIGILYPYLSEMAKAATSETGKSLAAGVLAEGKALLDLIRQRLVKAPNAEKTLDALANRPDDSRLQAVLSSQLIEALAADEDFAKAVAQCLDDIGQRVPSTSFHTTVAGGVEKQTNIGKVEGDVSF